METHSIILVACFLLLLERSNVSCEGKIRYFPPGFLFGSATAAYQVEGSWDADEKSPSIWDVMTHSNPSPIADNSTGDIACDSYNQYQRDINMTRELGLDFYRFSISWPRILPTGFPNKINDAGVEYYNKIINELLAINVMPVVTMYHWDLPETLQKMGGWASPKIVTWYLDYAKILFDLFGDRVKFWVTINEPKNVCYSGYGSYMEAPMLNVTGIADYMCSKNLLLAHAAAYHLYDDYYRKLQNGKIGILMSFTWCEPQSDTPEDYAAAIDANMFDWGIYTNPIFSDEGDFPIEVKRNVAIKSAQQGYPRSRLPELSPEEIAYIWKTSDFFGMNHYTSQLAHRNQSVVGMYAAPSYNDDLSAFLGYDPSWPQSHAQWLHSVPWGFYKLLKNIKSLYHNPPIYILENGWSTSSGLVDDDRISVLRGYLNAMLDAMDEGVNVKAYSVWSIMDNFEWMDGYSQKFGLYEVDFSSPERTRTPRKSAYVYKEILRSRQLDPSFEPPEFSTGSSK